MKINITSLRYVGHYTSYTKGFITKVSQYTDTLTHGHTFNILTHLHMNTLTYEHMDRWTHRHMETRTHWHMNTWTHEHTYKWTHCHMNTLTHEHTDKWTHWHMNTDTWTHWHSSRVMILCTNPENLEENLHFPLLIILVTRVTRLLN